MLMTLTQKATLLSVMERCHRFRLWTTRQLYFDVWPSKTATVRSGLRKKEPDVSSPTPAPQPTTPGGAPDLSRLPKDPPCPPFGAEI